MANHRHLGSGGESPPTPGRLRHGSQMSDPRGAWGVGAMSVILPARLSGRLDIEHQVDEALGSVIDAAARSGSATDDGRGHLIRRGTNARLFTMTSLVGRSSAQDDLENYHGRIASALNIDRVRKVLNFHLRRPMSHAGSTLSLLGPARVDTSAWDMGGWLGLDNAGRKTPI